MMEQLRCAMPVHMHHASYVFICISYFLPYLYYSPVTFS